MNFTREPIIETIITPKEGCKLVVRNSKGAGQEEFFVDALEVVSFGHALFFRSLERPKSFLVPVTDYEVLEVREIRMMLKTAPLEKGIKIGGGREANFKAPKEIPSEKSLNEEEQEQEEDLQSSEKEGLIPSSADQKFDKKRDRRRHRRRRGRGDERELPQEASEDKSFEEIPDEISPKLPAGESFEKPSSENRLKAEVQYPSHEDLPVVSPFATLLPPPTTLISETIARYRGNAEYKKAFFQEVPEESLPTSESPLEGIKTAVFPHSDSDAEALVPEHEVPPEVSDEDDSVTISTPTEDPFEQVFTVADYPILPKSCPETEPEDELPAEAKEEQSKETE